MVNIDCHHYICILSSNTFIENTTVARNDYIMDEDEEMTPTIDIENEKINEDDIELESESEVSEDDIELESEYERMMMEFNDSEENEGDRDNYENERDDDDGEETSSDEEEIIDQPLNNEQMSRFTQFGEFAPYFNNITESLFFCWMQKHRICKLDSLETYK